mmetsp:Transcript_15379/g.29360  ORF Transcript_15379/g.29360 Transcript_15379/m.29360 type:complete len:97 (+) Transcript_15379:109-399(+)
MQHVEVLKSQVPEQHLSMASQPVIPDKMQQVEFWHVSLVSPQHCVSFTQKPPSLLQSATPTASSGNVPFNQTQRDSTGSQKVQSSTQLVSLLSQQW